MATAREVYEGFVGTDANATLENVRDLLVEFLNSIPENEEALSLEETEEFLRKFADLVADEDEFEGDEDDELEGEDENEEDLEDDDPYEELGLGKEADWDKDD